MVDLKGIEPSNLTDANRALSQLSYRPKSALFTKKSCKFWISQIFDFQGKVQQIEQENREQKIGSDVSRYGCEKTQKTFSACFHSFCPFPLDFTLSVSLFNGLSSVCSGGVCGRFCGQKRFPLLAVGFPLALSGKRFTFLLSAL